MMHHTPAASHKLSLFLFTGFLFWSTNAVAEVTLVFGVYAADKPTVVVSKFKPLLKSLEQSLNKRLAMPVSIKLQVASTYEKGITNIAAGQVDFARLGPASYIEAKDQQPDLQILAVEAKKGKKRFNGVICVAADSPIKNASDLKGKRFAFGDRRSTIGRYLSQQYLLEQGLRASDLGLYDYLSRHDRVGTAVAAGQYDAGALKESTYKRLIEDGAPLRVLATFTNVTKPWIARVGLDGTITSSLRVSLLELTDPEVLKALKKDSFVEGDDGDYTVIRRAIQRNPAFFN